jgi:hypothetical protein
MAFECWFLGYASSIKRYRLQEKQNKSIIISLNVIFREDHYRSPTQSKEDYDKIN